MQRLLRMAITNSQIERKQRLRAKSYRQTRRHLDKIEIMQNKWHSIFFRYLKLCYKFSKQANIEQTHERTRDRRKESKQKHRRRSQVRVIHTRWCTT